MQKFLIIKKENILNARLNVKIENKLEDYKIFQKTLHILTMMKKYFQMEKQMHLWIKYEIQSKNIYFEIKENFIFSKDKTKIKDNNFQFYSLDNFNYQINKEILKGENIIIVTNFNLPESDKYYFSSAIIDLKKRKFVAKDTKIEIHKSIFNNLENDPRLIGLSSKGNEDLTVINKEFYKL